MSSKFFLHLSQDSTRNLFQYKTQWVKFDFRAPLSVSLRHGRWGFLVPLFLNFIVWFTCNATKRNINVLCNWHIHLSCRCAWFFISFIVPESLGFGWEFESLHITVCFFDTFIVTHSDLLGARVIICSFKWVCLTFQNTAFDSRSSPAS